MALRALLLRSRLDKKKKELEELRGQDADFAKREAELEAAIQEMTEETTEEERKEVEDQTEAFQKEKEEHEQKTGELEREIERIEGEIKEEEARSAVPPQPVAPAGPAAGAPQTERKGERTMTMRGKRFEDMSIQEREHVQPFGSKRICHKSQGGHLEPSCSGEHGADHPGDHAAYAEPDRIRDIEIVKVYKP